MLKVKKEGIIIKSNNNGFEIAGVLNPAVIAHQLKIHMFYRAVASGNYSSIGYCRLKGPLEVEEKGDKPVIFPQFDYEIHGVEDPRIVQVDGLFYLAYTAYDGINALGALATSVDLIHFEKRGLITPQITFNEFKRLAECQKPLNEKYFRYNKRDNIKTKHNKPVYLWVKNVVFFPRRIHNKLCFLIRIKPDIQLVSIEKLTDLSKEFWENYFQDFASNIILEPKHRHEVSYVGAGCPPVETQEGWLIIYHGVHDTPAGYVYTACAALFDLDNPSVELARLPYPLFYPEFEYEKVGEVNNVCFPTGSVLEGDTLYIYYGAADDQIACASVSLKELLCELLLNPTKNE